MIVERKKGRKDKFYKNQNLRDSTMLKLLISLFSAWCLSRLQNNNNNNNMVAAALESLPPSLSSPKERYSLPNVCLPSQERITLSELVLVYTTRVSEEQIGDLGTYVASSWGRKDSRS